MTKQMVMVLYIMLMEIYTKESGSMIKLMAKVFILMLMEQIIMVNGKMINSTDLELKSGLMEQFMKGIILKERKMEKENLHLQMDLFTKVTFK